MNIFICKFTLRVLAAVFLAASIAWTQDSSATGFAAGDVQKDNLTEEAHPPITDTQNTVSDTAKTDRESSVVQEEDILIIEGGEEENILQEETVPAAPVEAAGPGASDSSVKTTVIPGAAPASQTAEPFSASKESSGPENKNAEPVDQKPVIEDERSINFARNLKGYRSPKLAMLLSLIVPGLGQAYNGKYARAAIFGIVEAGIIVLGANVGIKGEKLKKDARVLADTSFNVNKLWNFYSRLDPLLSPGDALTEDNISDIKRDALAGLDSVEFLVEATETNNDYYENIGSDGTGLVQGWEDCEPVLSSDGTYTLDSTGYDYIYSEVSGDTIWLFNRYSGADSVPVDSYIWGYSEKQQEYISMVSKANDYSKATIGILSILIVNHVWSAAEAMISAKSHNDALMGRQSFWHRINLDQRMSFTDAGITSEISVRIGF